VKTRSWSVTTARILARALATLLALGPVGTARADTDASDGSDQDQTWAAHAQATFVDQGHLAFRSPYQGANSLSPDADGRETFDFTLFLGLRPWKGAEIWANPEIDQGFGLNGTLGLAGFPSGEAYKVGHPFPYDRLQRLFVRQTIDLSGETSKVDPDLDRLGGRQSANRIVITAGKFAVTDIFDANDYAHDPKHDFLNWTLIDTGTFDYAADAWGYTVGTAVEWYQGSWTLRSGVFDLSIVPNSETLDPRFSQFQLIEEVERRYQIAGRDGAVKLTGFLTRGRMGSYDDAVALAEEAGGTPSTALVRHYASRTGLGFEAQQKITGDLGAFARAGVAGGKEEVFEFTDVDRTVAAGLSLNGGRWGAPNDTVGLAGVVNGISKDFEAYLAHGGLAILVGDGRLPHPGPEEIVETYYDHAIGKLAHVALDFQFANNPAYNRDRGPVPILAIRLHAQY
jgi:high affinity Mn2+ porin